MNFFEAKLARSDGGAVVDFGNFHLPVPQQKLTQLSDYVGQDVYFGIRPENIHDAHFVPRGIAEAARFTAEVNVLEPLGSEVFAYIENGGKEMVAKFDPRTDARTGQTMEVVANMDAMHIFDRQSEKALV